MNGRTVRAGAEDSPEHQVKSRLLLDVVVAQRAAILQLLSGKDQSLLVWRDSKREVKSVFEADRWDGAHTLPYPGS